MISLVLGGMLLFPTLQPVQEVSEMPHEIPTPEPEKVEFNVVPSEYEIELREVEYRREQKRLAEERKRQEYESKFRSGTLTAYCNCKDVMNGETGVTASGYDLDYGITYKGYRILAADRSIALGTLIDIKVGNDIIHGIVLDRGGAIHGTHFDIVGRSRQSALKFGRQMMKWQKVGKVDI